MVTRQLASFGVTDQKSIGRCVAWVEARTKKGTVEVSVPDLALVWAVLEGHAVALTELDELIEAASRRAAGRSLEPAELAQRVRTRLLVAPRGQQPRLGTYDGRGKLKSWLWTATRLELLQATRGLAQSAAEDLDSVPELTSPARSPEANARSSKDTRLVSRALKEALDVLEPRERTLLRMRFVDGVSTEELGKMFQVHRTTAQRWIEASLAKIMTAMRARLEQQARLARGEVDSLVGEVAASISLRLSQVLVRDESLT